MDQTTKELDEKCFGEAMQFLKTLVDKYPVDYTSGEPSNYRLSADTLIGLVAHDKYKECAKR